MKLPKILKIGGFIWKVEERDDVTRQSNVWGTTHCHTQTIYLEPNLSEQKKWQTLLHETLHAVYWQCGLGEDKAIPEEAEEKIIHALSMGMYQVLKDNRFLR